MKNNYLYGILLGFSIISFAQDVEDVVETQIEQAEQSEAVEEVVTTGSRIARSALDMAQPVTIISGDEFKIRGYTNAAQALTDLPWNAVTGEGETAELGWGLASVVIIDGADTDSAGVATWLIVDPVAWRPFNAWTCWIA